MSYWFFLSYARLDLNPTLKKFYNDLADTVRRIAGGRREEIGFFDGFDIKAGERWTAELTEALQTSGAFVALYSPTYFDARFCGKEWAVFSSRIDEYTKQNGTKQPPLMLPVLWVSEDVLKHRLPKATLDIQYTHEEFGEVYAKEGLYQLMTVSEYKPLCTESAEVFPGLKVLLTQG